ncbi:MAG: hypothetical protein HC866_02200 [Leptolyngbyaceae cyanobacterium RU_5_1]|nr:hypothetical protein [Leptolyngbyaceae cyanobacterium RU_5_1]
MLKLTYTETGIYLEYLAQSLEELITQRIILAMRVSESLMVEPGRASFLLPTHSPELNVLWAIADRQHDEITLCPTDEAFIEVTLRGVWLSHRMGSEEGIFLAELRVHTERLIWRIWQASVSPQSSLTDAYRV